MIFKIDLVNKLTKYSIKILGEKHTLLYLGIFIHVICQYKNINIVNLVINVETVLFCVGYIRQLCKVIRLGCKELSVSKLYFLSNNDGIVIWVAWPLGILYYVSFFFIRRSHIIRPVNHLRNIVGFKSFTLCLHLIVIHYIVFKYACPFLAT